MFTHRIARVGLAKVQIFVHVLLACIALPLAVSYDHSVTTKDYGGLARRMLPSMSFTMIEERTNNGPPTPGNAVPYRRSLHRTVNQVVSNVLQQAPVFLSRRSNMKGNLNYNENIMTVYSKYDDTFTSKTSMDVMESANDPFVDKLEAKLHACVTFRTRIIIVFGQILRAPQIKLTIHQFTSLNLILQTLIHKQVYMFNLLSVLKKLQSADRVTQFKLVLEALSNNVPVYIVGACKFWLNEIENHNIDINEITAVIKQPAEFLTGINPVIIDGSAVENTAEELEPFDEASKITKEALGLVFVKIFGKLKNREIILSQKLFAAILINLPIGELNPVLQEHINYIWDVTQDNSLSNWHDIAPKIEYGNPYEIVNFVAKELLSKQDTPDVFKQALQYVLLHLKRIPNTYSDEYYPDMQILTNNDEYVKILLSVIQDDVTNPELGDLRDHLLDQIQLINMDHIFKGMNKQVYRKPIDMLIALLVRIQTRIQDTNMREMVSKLLAILISKDALDSLGVTVPVRVDLVLLLDFLIMPKGDPDIPNLVQRIQYYLKGNPDLLDKLQGLISNENKLTCHRPVQCLLNIFSKILELNIISQLGVPSDFVTMIRELTILIKKAITSSAKCEAHDLMSFESPEMVHNSLRPIFIASAFTSTPTLAPSSHPTVTSSQPVEPTSIPTDTKGATPEFNYPIPPITETAGIPYSTPPDLGGITSSEDGTIRTTPATPIPTSSPNFKPQPTGEPPSKTVTLPSEGPSSYSTTLTLPSEGPSSYSTTLTLPSEGPSSYSTTSNPIISENPPNAPSEMANEPILPPNLSFDRPIYVVFSQDDTPPYIPPTKPGDVSDSQTVVEFPPIKVLLQELNPNTPFTPEELPDMPELLEPLKQTLGPNFVHTILGKIVDKTQYPTVISLLTDLLNHALTHENVKANPNLVSTIKLFLKGIDYITATALFPVVIDSQKLPSDVLHVTIDPDNPKANSIDPEPPRRVPATFVTLPIYHPKYWVQKVDPINPYGTLLPSAEDGKDNPIQQLLKEGSLQQILGPSFDPLLYPNRGMLLTMVLQKLISSPRVISDVLLMKKLSAYLKSIRNIALYTKVPNDYYIHVIGVQQSNKANWQPDTASLMVALPPATNQHELQLLNVIKSFLETPNLLEMLQIFNLPYSTSRGILLKMIFDAAIRGNKVILDPQTLSALKYYENMILLKGRGALPIVWVWVQMIIIREEVPLGEIIETVIEYDSLPYELKVAYNELMIYLAENPQFLQGNNDFAFESFDTKGSFLKGLFTHFLGKPKVSEQSKHYLKQLIPQIKLTGRGLEKMHHITIDDVTNGQIDTAGFSVFMHG